MTSAARTLVNHGGRRLPWFTFSLAAAILLLYGLLGPAPETLVYDRDAVHAGQLWRVFTGHLIHGDASHLAWNLGAFLALGSLVELWARLPSVPHLFLLALGGATISAWLWWGMPELSRYLGLSAVLNTQFAYIFANGWRSTRSRLLLLIGFGAVAKILVEMAAGTALFTAPIWPSVPEAHAAGFAAGLAASKIWSKLPVEAT